jgi:hypothetical protein
MKFYSMTLTVILALFASAALPKAKPAELTPAEIADLRLKLEELLQRVTSSIKPSPILTPRLPTVPPHQATPSTTNGTQKT